MPNSPAPESHAAAASAQDEPSPDGPPPPPSTHAQSAQKRKTTFGIKQHTYNPAPPVYDYEQKYPPDAPYHEIDEDARIWHVYNDEAEILDKDMIEEAGDSLDILLIFAALFSGVVTTLVVETAGKLDTDYTEVTANLLQEMVALQRAGDNTTARSAIPSAELTTPPSNADIWVNGLWFTSLTLSLSMALLAVLAKQWLRQYSSVVTGPARERAFVRQFRWEGFDAWRVQAIIGMLPTILHTSLGLFLAGLVVFLYSLDTIIARAALGLSASLGGVYAATTFLPILFVKCPYRTQLSTLLAWPIWQVLYICTYLCNSLAHMCYMNYNRSDRIELLLGSIDNFLGSCVHSVKSRSRSSAKEVERVAAVGAVQSIPERAPELVVWLTRNTASSSAKRIALQSLGPSNLDRLSYSNRVTLYHDGADPNEAVKLILSNGDQGHESAKLEALQRWICAIVSFYSRGYTIGLNGLEVTLPTLELALLTLSLFISASRSRWPKQIAVKTPSKEFALFEEEMSRGDSLSRTVWNRLLQHCEPSDLPRFPLHIWNLLKGRECLRGIEGVDKAHWKKIVDEVLEHNREYAEELQFPDSHQTPISFARYCVPLFVEKKWLVKKGQSVIYDTATLVKGRKYGDLSNGAGTSVAGIGQGEQTESADSTCQGGYAADDVGHAETIGDSAVDGLSLASGTVEGQCNGQEGQSSQTVSVAAPRNDIQDTCVSVEDMSEHENLAAIGLGEEDVGAGEDRQIDLSIPKDTALGGARVSDQEQV